MQGIGKLAEILEVHALPRDRTKGVLRCGPITVPCALGRSGVIGRKREGDGATPLGSFEVLHVYYRGDRGPRPQTSLPVETLKPGMGWCDDPCHRRYNRPVDLPFAASHEKMWRDDRLYDIVVVLDCNMYPPVKGQGSAIFFHIAREDYRPTEGCVAVYPQHMRLILSKIAPGCQMVVRG
ncbi:L,D-transpeptidase [Labrenzia sp. PHM005]|uniref:L,D-transpeptidase family protein n=1 Tax=Labrenzia sp. PHM005 TaxID=2590016 RepID=UPI001AD8C07A|nr:L,D-transpeptidase family protein [Labrenzia sp. PHM005]